MTSYKIENFFGHLDRNQTKEAVAHGAGRLTIYEVADAVTQDMTAEQISEMVAHLIRFVAELDPGEAA